MTKLKLANDLALPLDAVTQTFLVVGKRGSGKSNTAARFVEQLYHARIPFVVLDPVDTWWGLKAARDGGVGLGVYVFGGRHADLPLEAGEKAGALAAEVLCEHRLSMVLSVKHLSGRERSTFMVAFAQTLFQKWSGGPLHIVLEEAHELAPQSTMNAKEGEQQMLGAFKRLWKLGRASGIGGTAITQRPASLSKDITTQSEILIAHRTIGPQDVKAVGEWVKYHGEQLDMLAELPSLPTGEAFVWAPEFPEGKPIGLQRVSMLLRETYDSASTPKVGEHRVEPKDLAAVDMERLRAKMTATIERAKADDPKELRKRIAELERAAKSAPTKTVEKPVVDEQAIARAVAAAVKPYKDKLDAVRRYIAPASQLVAALDDQFCRISGEAISEVADAPLTAPPANGIPSAHRPRKENFTPTPPRRPIEADRVSSRVKRSNNGGAPISRTAQRMLNALLFLETVGTSPASRQAIAGLTSLSWNTGSFRNNVSELRVAGYITDGPNSTLALTDAGRAHADDDRLPITRDELHAAWRSKLGRTTAKMFDILIHSYPEPVERSQLAEVLGLSWDTGSFRNNLSEMRSPGLIVDVSRTAIRAADALFPEGLS